MYLLTGFVNQYFTPQLCIGILQTETKEFRWIMDKEIESQTEGVLGLSGVIEYCDKLIAVFQSSPPKMIIFNRDYSIHKVHRLPGLENVHSFCHYHDHLLCVSAGTNEVYELHFDSDFALIGCRLFWRCDENRSGHEYHHINSITLHGGEVYATCFGAEYTEDRFHCANGKLINISKNEILLGNLHHPHSIHFSDDNWVLCESGNGTVLFQNGKSLEIGGYTRGIDEDDTYYVIGSSGRQLISGSRTAVNLEMSHDRIETQSSVNIVSKENLQVVERIGTGDWGTEIYDLLCIDDLFAGERFQDTNPREQQVYFLEKQIMQLQQDSQLHQSKNHLLKRIYKKLKLLSKSSMRTDSLF